MLLRSQGDGFIDFRLALIRTRILVRAFVNVRFLI